MRRGQGRDVTRSCLAQSFLVNPAVFRTCRVLCCKMFEFVADGDLNDKSRAKAPVSHQCVGSTKEEWRDGTIPVGGLRNSPSAAVAGGRRKDSKSRRRDRSRNPRREWTSSGESLAGSARSKSHGKIRNLPQEWLARELSIWSSRTTPFTSLVWGRSGRSSWFTSARLRDLEWCEETGAALHIGKCQLSRRSRSRSQRDTGRKKRNDRDRPRAGDCRSWTSPFRTDGRRRPGGPSCDSDRRAGFGPTRETDGRKEFQRAKEPSLGKQNWGSQPARRRWRTKWRKEGREESIGEACATVARVADSSGNESATCFSPKRYPSCGNTRKAERGAGAFRTKASRLEMVARSAGGEGTRIDGRRTMAELDSRRRRGQAGSSEDTGKRNRRKREPEGKRRRSLSSSGEMAAYSSTDEDLEREDDSKVRRTAATKLGAILHSGLVMMHRHLGRQVEDCESVDAVQSKGVAAAYLSTALKPNAESKQARIQEHSRMAVISRSRGSADAWTSCECRRRADSEIPRSRSVGTGGRRMVTRTSSRTAARSSSVDSVIWSSGG